jgi:hypothetical protein
MKYIYILRLISNKYYVGKTTNPNFRLEQHFNLKGTNFTKKYKPIEIIKIIPNCDNFDEDKYTLEYMKLFGIDNVRGGSFCEIKLSNDNVLTIQKMINGSSNNCYKCGKSGHFANECNNSILGRKVSYSENDINYSNKKFKKTIICYLCGEEGHIKKKCTNLKSKTNEL